MKWLDPHQERPPPGVHVLAQVSLKTHPIVVHRNPTDDLWVWSGLDYEAPMVLRWSWLPEST